ncbi:pyridine nucleotide-disulfide oxidoreductase [Aureococcus anophagefferens]|nr:pyridine nucleotide-disulfide oxidoreductase [Aureococcus anophagefferens]
MAAEEEFAIEIPDAEADKITRAARARAGAPAWGDAEPRPQLEDESKPDPGEGAFREAWVMFQLALRFVPENEDAQEEYAATSRPSRRRTSSTSAGTEVTAVTPRDGGFDVAVVPAAGGVPAVIKTRRGLGRWRSSSTLLPASPLPGSELCRHNSSVRSWTELEGDDFVVVGGYESGMDAASNLSLCGKRCTVASPTAYWDAVDGGPVERARALHGAARPRGLRVRDATEASRRSAFAVDAAAGGGFAALGDAAEHEGGDHREPAPLLCAGFEGGVKLGVAKDLFAWGDPAVGDDDEEDDDDAEGEGDDRDGDDDGEMSDEGDEKKGGGCADGAPLLNEYDESTTTPGLFLVGPAVIHGDLSFCFVYKFRQRFGVVADAIARGLGRETGGAAARDMNMYMDDFECCKAACGEAC